MEGIYLQRLAKDALGLSEALGTEQGLAVALARGEQPGPRGGGGRNVQVGWVSKKVGKTWENMERSIKNQHFSSGSRISHIFLLNSLKLLPKAIVEFGDGMSHLSTPSSVAIEHGKLNMWQMQTSPASVILQHFHFQSVTG